jgi:diguanylate cyclase (GGDEF)-like protein
VSGSRIKAKFFDTPDGAHGFSGWYDSVLKGPGNPLVPTNLPTPYATFTDSLGRTFVRQVGAQAGHPTGDQVLKRVTAILKASARKIDIVGRYGGEEFALVLEGTDRTGARQLAERIRQEVGAQKHDSAKGAFRATLSLGVAVYPEDGKSKQDLISNADQALYAAKHGGRNRTVCHGEIVRAKDAPPAARAAAG